MGMKYFYFFYFFYFCKNINSILIQFKSSFFFLRNIKINLITFSVFIRYYLNKIGNNIL
jgi:hypothetical protein